MRGLRSFSKDESAPSLTLQVSQPKLFKPRELVRKSNCRSKSLKTFERLSLPVRDLGFELSWASFLGGCLAAWLVEGGFSF